MSTGIGWELFKESPFLWVVGFFSGALGGLVATGWYHLVHIIPLKYKLRRQVNELVDEHENKIIEQFEAMFSKLEGIKKDVAEINQVFVYKGWKKPKGIVDNGKD